MPEIANEINPRFYHYEDLPEKGLKHRFVDDETYGKKSFIYIKTPQNKILKEKIISALEKRGFKVSRDYYPKGWFIEIQVSYFKGYNWDA